MVKKRSRGGNRDKSQDCCTVQTFRGSYMFSDVFGSTFILMSFKSNTFFHSLGLGFTVREKTKLRKGGKNW